MKGADIMLSINNFLQGFMNFVKSISKKAYRTCAIIASGVTVIAVVTMTSQSFGGGGHNSVTEESEQTSELKEEAGEEEETSTVAEAAEMEKTEVQVVAVRKPQVGSVYTDEKGNKLVENNIGLTITQEDYEALKRIVEAEAGNQDEVGRMLVANVIINRVLSSKFPNTITEIIFQNGGNVYQFEPIQNGFYYKVNPSDSTAECVDRVLSGEDYSQGALFFTRQTSQYSWFNTSLTLLFIHGVHYFYK